MESNVCMNGLCGARTSSEWKRGWAMKSGGFARLCYNCWIAYDNGGYCEKFHLNEPGWRECKYCEKPIHCGCIVSTYLHDYIDSGGIACIPCVRANMNPSLRSLQSCNDDNDIQNSFSSVVKLINSGPSAAVESQISGVNGDKGKYKPFLPTPSNNIDPTFASGIGVTESNEPVKVTPFKQIQANRPIILKFSKLGSGSNAQSPQANNKVTSQQNRVPRTPADYRGRNQLHPRYWPKITDQELEQISLDLKSKIVPLFEKILSASDAGRIGRLVLPKACAEIYFPPISNSEGVPIRIQDIKGKEWIFQFRFWPNNNSRMYVLEGVTPCMQTMELQAGDSVIFSRTDPGNKLVIGCRKETNSVDTQEAKTSHLPNGLSGKKEYEGTNGHSVKKRSRNIGLKIKRLLMQREDSKKLRITWTEGQELLRPNLGAKPNVLVIANREIEEHDESPVFGKRTIFTMQASGEREQWGQCDSCFKWRRLPLDIFLPPSWTCSDNTWDPNRRSCSAPEELKNTRELKRIFDVSRGYKRRRRNTKKKKIAEEQEEPTGLDALALAASGDLDGAETATTRHPRHRPGCTCIVCIQPPSGKGNHNKSTCICNACSSVNRRCKTLMLRKKKRQEAEIAQGVPPPNEGTDYVGSTEDVEMEIVRKERVLDLNCEPNREEEEVMMMGAETSLVNGASLPLEGYNRNNGVENMGPCVLSRAVSETDECFLPLDEADDESKGDGK